MKITKIRVQNYRLLKDFSIDLENDLSLIIGKNNTGKTSLLSVLSKFLNSSERSRFSFDDINISEKNEITRLATTDEVIEKDSYLPRGISLRLFIDYNEFDDLSRISKIMMDLMPSNNVIVLGFDYSLHYEYLEKLRDDFRLRSNGKNRVDAINHFLQQRHSDYFRFTRRSVEYNPDTKDVDETNFIDLDKESIPIKDIISFKYISARRAVDNRENDKSLSSQTSRIYKRFEELDEMQSKLEDFKDKLMDTDFELSGIYAKMFGSVIEKVKKFGGIRPEESVIKIASTLQHKELLTGNTTVMYDHEGHVLPEHYNGLGYMNLISMIFEIELLLNEFKKSKDEKPADINLLFIEEPEAHTHPQMQYIFIKNIKDLIAEGLKREDGIKVNLQYVISTHSSHIVSENSNFNDIKYLKRVNSDSVIAKNLQDLEKEYDKDGEEQNFRFLKQYLTLNRAELFFADKAILIEGETERILLPAMMKKIDQQSSLKTLPLLSQNISIIEVGAYTQIFEKFIDFLGIKTLIITDLDSGIKADTGHATACRVNDNGANITTNSSLKFFFDTAQLACFIGKDFNEKLFKKDHDDKKWISDDAGHLLIVYQTEENKYHARSFEDAFFHLNKDFAVSNDNSFVSLTEKWLAKYKNAEIDAYDFSENAVGSKPSLAIEILLNSRADDLGREFGNWKIPNYIKEGLEWLQKD